MNTTTTTTGTTTGALTKDATNLPAAKGGGPAEAVTGRQWVAPAVDVFENKDELLVVADVPGTTQDAVTIRLHEDELTIEARRTAGGGGEWDWRRAFVVPQDVDADKVAADLRDGVLRVRLPKREAAKPRQIAVKVG